MPGIKENVFGKIGNTIPAYQLRPLLLCLGKCIAGTGCKINS